jgi:hypothetical protein
MTGFDIAVEAFAEAHGDPKRAIKIARSMVIIGPDSITGSEFKQMIINGIWDLYSQLDETP